MNSLQFENIILYHNEKNKGLLAQICCSLCLYANLKFILFYSRNTPYYIGILFYATFPGGRSRLIYDEYLINKLILLPIYAL